jgi:hypothetical protein
MQISDKLIKQFELVITSIWIVAQIIDRKSLKLEDELAVIANGYRSEVHIVNDSYLELVVTKNGDQYFSMRFANNIGKVCVAYAAAIGNEYPNHLFIRTMKVEVQKVLDRIYE